MVKSKKKRKSRSKSSSPSPVRCVVNRRSRTNSPVKNLLATKYSTAVGSLTNNTTDVNNNDIKQNQNSSKSYTKKGQKSRYDKSEGHMFFPNHFIPVSSIRNVSDFKIQRDLFSPAWKSFQKRLNEEGEKARLLRQELHAELNERWF